MHSKLLSLFSTSYMEIAFHPKVMHYKASYHRRTQRRTKGLSIKICIFRKKKTFQMLEWKHPKWWAAVWRLVPTGPSPAPTVTASAVLGQAPLPVSCPQGRRAHWSSSACRRHSSLAVFCAASQGVWHAVLGSSPTWRRYWSLVWLC